MDIQQLRDHRELLQYLANYCPPGKAHSKVFGRAEDTAIRADAKLHELAPAFALLDAIDGMAARLEQLETATTCGGCGQRVAWECPNCGFENHMEANRPEEDTDAQD